MTPTVTLNTGVEILEAGYRSIDTAAVAAGSGRGRLRLRLPVRGCYWAHFGVQVSAPRRAVPRWARSDASAGCGLSPRQISECG